MMRRKRCAQCGKLKDGVFKSKNPFTEEIYPEEANTETLWCPECFQDACDDI